MAASAGTEMTLLKKGKDCGKVAIVKAQVAGVESVTEQVAKMAVAPSASPSVTSSSNKPNIIDYVSGGCKLNVAVAIDFTGSNGDPRKPGTLHHMDPNSKNDYEKAISSILAILEKYDDNKQFPVLGFGAKYNGVVNHCFQ